jgi:hypothetical protein
MSIQASYRQIGKRKEFSCVYQLSFLIAKTNATILDANPRILAPAAINV